MNIASYIEHSFLEPTTRSADIELICKEAVRYDLAAVCVPPMFVKKATICTAGSQVKTAAVIGFPFGYNAIEAKLAEAVLAIVDGADELDMMINLVALKNEDWQYLAKEINTVLTVVRKSEKIIKVIIEAGLLSEKEIVACCDIYGAAAVDFIQTSTGYAGKITIDTLKLIRRHLADPVKIKSNDGVHYRSAPDWIAAGASRIVCNGPVKAVNELSVKKGGTVFENGHSNKN